MAQNPCQLSQGVLMQLHKENFGHPIWNDYLFRNVPGTKKHPPRDDVDDHMLRCLKCGCTIDEHHVNPPDQARLVSSMPSAQQPEEDFFFGARRMRYVLLKLLNILGTRIKERIRNMAIEAKVSGYVERTSLNTFTILAVTPLAMRENLQTFISMIIENFEKRNVVEARPNAYANNDKLVRIHAMGFKKVSNSQCVAASGASSAELTPEDGASDVVSHISVTSAMVS